MTPEELLSSVRVFKDNLSRRANYHDYELWKHQFLAAGFYGYEGQIADILEV